MDVGMGEHITDGGSSNTTDSTVTANDEKPNLVDRRSALKATAGASAALLAGCLNQSAGSVGDSSGEGFEGETLTTSVWSGKYTDYFKNTIKPMYEEETGANLRLVPGWSDLISKIKAAPEDQPPYDVCVTEGLFYKQARDEDLFLSLREENVPNLEEVYPYVKDLKTTEYGIPFDGAPIAVMYNNEKIDYDIDTWQTLIDENTKLTLDGGFYAYTLHIAAIVADEMEGVGEIYNEEHHDVPFETAKEFNAVSYYASGAERWQQMQQRIADAAQSYFGVSMGRKSENDWISVDLPEQTSGYYDHYGVVRGTDKREMAEHFLNFMLRKDVQEAWGEESHQLLANSNAQHSEAGRDAGFPSSDEEYESFHFPDYEYLADYSDEFSSRFEELKQS